MKYVSFAACLVLIFAVSCAEPSSYHYKASGSVLDEAGAPVEGVKIVLRGYDLGLVKQVTTMTGHDGTFVLTFDVDPFEWRQEAHWVFDLIKEGYVTRSVAYPEFSFDDRFRQQGYWYKVFFRGPAVLKKAKEVPQSPVKAPTPEVEPTAMPLPTPVPSGK